MLLSVSTFTSAEYITNAEIDSISVNAPIQWSTNNIDFLFDGITDRYTPTRFAAYQNGGDLLSNSNTYDIDVALTNGIDIDSISFLNDWRHYLGQQVMSMDVALYNDVSGLLWSDSFSDLKQNSWDVIDLMNFDTPIYDVTDIAFSITGSQGNHFEIRELLVGVHSDTGGELATSEVSTPGIIGIVFIVLGAMFYRNVKTKPN